MRYPNEMVVFLGMLYLTWCVVFAPVVLLAGIKDRLAIRRPIGRFVLAMVASVVSQFEICRT